MTRYFGGACILLALWSGSALGQPLSTAFIYQGELSSAGTPATGQHDFRFRLYSADTGGTQLGSTLCSDNVMLSDGRFTQLLDFGNQYSGQKRFLEIEVRTDTGLDCTDATGYTVLSPRQELSAAPNAAYAINAGAANTAVSATTAASAINSNQLNGQPAAFYQSASNLTSGVLLNNRLGGTYSGVLTFSNAGNSFSGSGAGLINLNASSIITGSLDSARLPVPLSLSGSVAGAGLIHGSNSSDALASAGVRGVATGGSESVYGVVGESASTSGFGVYGIAGALSGFTRGVSGVAHSGDGAGVVGEATSDIGFSSGGAFYSYSVDGVGVRGHANATSGGAMGGLFRSNSTNGIGVYGHAIASSGFAIGGQFVSQSSDGHGIYSLASSLSGTTSGVWGVSQSTEGRGIYGLANAASGDSYGGYFVSLSSSGTGVFGLAGEGGANFGGRFESLSESGTGVVGTASANTGNSIGVLGRTESRMGSAVVGEATSSIGLSYAGRFSNAGSPGYGVHAETTSTGGNTVAGYFRSAGVGGIGVVGEATNSGISTGGYFTIASSGGNAVSGYSSSATGTTSAGRFVNQSTSGTGVYAEASALSGTTYGVWGFSNSASIGAYGVWAQGRSGASGTKSFRIDHPADPENKYLLHYSAESPEVINFYSGKVTLDEAGEAIVELPAYFARVNKDPRYTLTAVGAPMPMLHVAVEISDDAIAVGEKAAPGDAVPVCSFRIAGGAPGAKVSWRVEAVRNDLWMRHRAAPVEAEKEGRVKGTYQHPEFYGLPAERGINADLRSPPAPVEPAQAE